ncbi:hypothetical protein KUBF_12580 [Bacteroides finegoldii]|nr:hypothetical protein KUBF_12580 [Bacteroides finegoldii]
MNSMLIRGKQAKIFIVKYKEKIIGGAVCIYSGESAFLWFSGGMRKTYALQYPGILAVWKALEDAHQRGFRHMEFMDVGLPFRKHGYRISCFALAENKAAPAAGFVSVGLG